MLMAFGTLLFLVLAASAVLGVVMGIAGCVLFFLHGWQRIGIAILFPGLLGSAFALLGFAGAGMLVGGAATLSMEALLIGAAGFGWFSLLSIVLVLGLYFLRQPARWIDRKRKAR